MRSTEDATNPQMLAAVDLGSNSFRMVIARQVADGLQPIDRLREGVRLAAYLDDKQNLTAEGRRRALACLRKFGQRLREFPPGSVRAVGTNTLRKARNTAGFLRHAQQALGHPIEVVSGQEEARLIFLGASHSLATGAERRLVVDIGGGSTECIVGEGFEPLRTESLYMGCVSYTQKHFPAGRITAGKLRRAVTAARLELRSAKADFRRLGWDRCVGASGTVQAVVEILRQNNWSDQGITHAGLDRLRQELLDQGHVEKLQIPGLRRERARVLPGGFAILVALFESLKIERMLVSTGAMREGVLHDLLGRLRHEDARDQTIQRFVAQYSVDVQQAERVEDTALACLQQVQASWDLDPRSGRLFLKWAASLHEIGLAVAHSAFHKHGAYLVQHSDMPGFSYQNQRLLALLLRGQRRKLPKDLFGDLLPRPLAKTALRLCVLLRLACLLNRSRSPRQRPDLQLRAKGKRLKILFPAGWAEKHPMTLADLEQEKTYLAAVGLSLRVGSVEPKQEVA